MEEKLRAAILKAIERDQSEILEFTKDLVSIPTENPPGAFYRPCIEAIGNKLSEMGLDSQVIEVPVHAPNGSANGFPRYCIRSSYGEGERSLYFHGHYDVVPASNKDQFKPVFKEGKLFGRGSSDMKSGLAAMMFAVKAIKSSKIDLNGSICLTMVPDEETGGKLGSKYLADVGILGKNGIGMLIPEPTSGVVWNANRGAVSLLVTVKGKPAHVGLQYEGMNAFEKMLSLAYELLELKKQVELRTTDYNIQPEPARHSILMIGGQSKGGNSFNLVPEEFSFSVDRRINPEEDLEAEKQNLFDLFEAAKRDGIDLEVEILQEGQSAGTPEGDPIGQVLARSIEAVTGNRPPFEMCPGLLEIRFYVDKGIPSFAYGPGLLSVSHGPGEFVRLEDICKCAAVYAFTALEVLTA